MSDPKCPTPEELSFEAALTELDDVVAELEGGQLELEESIVRYQRGVALLLSLQAKLTDAQQKVTMLVGELEAETSDQTPVSTDPSGASTDEAEIPF